MRLVYLTMFILISACSTVQKSGEVARKIEGNLSQEYAAYRNALVSSVEYDLSFHLTPNLPDFTGRVSARFQMIKPGTLTLDFAGGSILSLSINGRKVSSIAYNGFFVELPRDFLAAGDNHVEIEFTHPYSNDGSGLYRFKDSEDGRSYLYTDFEPYDANKLFPCFDQPDLKARYSVEAKVPTNWTVITSNRETSVEAASEGQSLWKFPKSEIFSTYIFSLHAGEYSVFSDVYKTKSRQIPLRLLVRKALARYLNKADWFLFTKQGLEYYEKYFGTQYPYSKYDQILVPDFNSGAMENVAAVTFNEHYVSRGIYTRNARESIASVLLHEMAHMWFGDLVTMKWWNDLWLNETFATYMSTKALVANTEFKESWVRFFGSKVGGYNEDSLITTHPIEDTVPSTDRAFANFDGITYNKGAGVMKQLDYRLGFAAFQKGVDVYFKKYATKNTVRSEFIGALAASGNQNLDGWSREWLQTSGANTVSSQWECSEGQLSKLILVQGSDARKAPLRSHKLAVGLLNFEGGKLKLSKEIPLELVGQETPVASAIGLKCPDAVFPNWGDHAYIKIKFDSASLAAFSQSLQKVEDSLARYMVLETLWNMVREGEMDLRKFYDLTLASLAVEKEERNLDALLGKVGVGGYRWGTVRYYLSRSQNKNEYEEFSVKLEDLLYRRLKSALPASDDQKRFFDYYVATAKTGAAAQRLRQLLEGKESLPGLVIDQDQRWGVLARLNEFEPAKAKVRVEKELARDPSDQGRKSSLGALARVGTDETKARVWAQIFEPGANLSTVKELANSIFPVDQVSFRASYGERFYTELLKANALPEVLFASSISRTLVPATCEKAANEVLAEFINDNSSVLKEPVKKALLIAHEEDARCIRILKK